LVDTVRVDAVNALVGGAQRAQATVDAAAEQVAAADLPTTPVPDAASPAPPDPSTNVDVAEQLTTMMVAAGTHHATTAALRAAMSMYSASVDMLASSQRS
jgi:hypothetical protein